MENCKRRTDEHKETGHWSPAYRRIWTRRITECRTRKDRDSHQTNSYTSLPLKTEKQTAFTKCIEWAQLNMFLICIIQPQMLCTLLALPKSVFSSDWIRVKCPLLKGWELFLNVKRDRPQRWNKQKTQMLREETPRIAMYGWGRRWVLFQRKQIVSRKGDWQCSLLCLLSGTCPETTFSVIEIQRDLGGWSSLIIMCPWPRMSVRKEWLARNSKYKRELRFLQSVSALQREKTGSKSKSWLADWPLKICELRLYDDDD